MIKQIREDSLDAGKVTYESVHFEKNQPVKIQRIKVLANQIESVIPYHWHRCIEIIVPILNGAEIWTENEIHRIFPGNFFLSNSQEEHLCRDIYPYLEYQGYIIQINYSFLKSHCLNFDDRFFENDLPLEIKEKIYHEILDLIEANNLQTDYANLVLESHLLSLLALLMQHSSKKETPLKKVVPEIIGYVSDNFNMPLTVQEIADHFHISYSQLEKIFKKYFGMSVKEYISSIRLKNAVYQLLNTNDNMTQITYENGFANMKSFYKTFKNTYHATPLEFKRMMNERK